jgi:hypothetical protein
MGAGTVFATGEHEDDERPTDDEEPMDDEEAPDDELDVVSSAVRVAHFSPDAPDVDVLVDGDQVLADVTYGDISPYLELEPGTYTVTIAAADDPETVAFEGEVEIDEAFYTVAAIGELEEETFRPEVLTDAEPLPEDAEADSAFVRVAHFSPDAPAVDVYADDEPLVEDVSFEDVSEYLAVPAGEYTLSIRPAGEEEEVASFDVTLEAETPYTGYAIGYLEPPEDVTDRDFTVELAVDGPAASAEEEEAVENDDEVPDDENEAPEEDAPNEEEDAPKDEADEKEADGKENGKEAADEKENGKEAADEKENGKEAADEKENGKDVGDKDAAKEKQPADGKNGVDEKKAANGKDTADGKKAANGKDADNGKAKDAADGKKAANGKDAADGKKAAPDQQC